MMRIHICDYRTCYAKNDLILRKVPKEHLMLQAAIWKAGRYARGINSFMSGRFSPTVSGPCISYETYHRRLIPEAYDIYEKKPNETNIRQIIIWRPKWSCSL